MHKAARGKEGERKGGTLWVSYKCAGEDAKYSHVWGNGTEPRDDSPTYVVWRTLAFQRLVIELSAAHSWGTGAASAQLQAEDCGGPMPGRMS